MRQGLSSRVHFREVQRFSQWWVWLIIAACALFQWWWFVEQIIFGRPFGDNPGPDWMAWLFTALFGIGLPWLFISAKLITEVRSDALYIQYFPFHLKPLRIGYDSIAGCAAGKYNPILDYGGWGIKHGRGGKVYNASGNMGVLLEFNDGTHLMVGSQHSVELAEAIAGAKT